jgi:membrane protease subunit (stomatin/prohibitin family)
MGLIKSFLDGGIVKAVLGGAGGVLADQWLEYIYCESISPEILVTKGAKKYNSRRSANKKGDDNVISNGSIVAVNEGQFMIIVDGGKVVEFSGEPGEFLYDTSTEPSLFCGDLSENIHVTFRNIGKRIAFGGEAPKDQRVYYFNKKEILSNKYGTPNAVPFRVIDRNINLDIDISIRCHGEYSYKIVDPLLFLQTCAATFRHLSAVRKLTVCSRQSL